VDIDEVVLNEQVNTLLERFDEMIIENMSDIMGELGCEDTGMPDSEDLAAKIYDMIYEILATKFNSPEVNHGNEDIGDVRENVSTETRILTV
jgi:hypothetical protein